MGRVADKVAIVTGAGSGIGRASAQALAREGALLVATDIDERAAEATAAAIRDAGGRALALRHDVADEASWRQVIDACLDAHGRLDVLVNNAGLADNRPLIDTSLDDWRRIFRVNVDGVFIGTREAARTMRPAGFDPAAPHGSVINLSSILGLVGSPDAAAYSASKGAVRLFTKSAAIECATKGWRVRVNSIHPGYVWTPMVEAGVGRRAAIAGTDSEKVRSYLQSQHPIGRLGRVEDIAQGVVYLASDESSFVTGTELVIDGGYTAR